jgi:hypothetical protein
VKDARKRIVAVWKEDWLKFECLIFHLLSGLIMTYITRFEVITGVLSRSQFFWDVTLLELKAQLFFETSEGHSPEDAASHRRRHEPYT